MALTLSAARAQTPAPVARAPGPVAILLIEINSRSEDLVEQLRELSRQLPGKADLERLDKALVEDLTALRARASDTDILFANNPTLSLDALAARNDIGARMNVPRGLALQSLMQFARPTAPQHFSSSRNSHGVRRFMTSQSLACLL